MKSLPEASTDTVRLNRHLIEGWRLAARDLGLRVTAPVELLDAKGRTFVCEAFVEDFGSPDGAVVVSQKTERRVRPNIRSLGDKVWCCVEGQPTAYRRKNYIDRLRDWGWFGTPGSEPSWYYSDHA
jgi:hypothetical protein